MYYINDVIISFFIIYSFDHSIFQIIHTYIVTMYLMFTRYLSLLCDLRGWVRKFCHRCYNFVNRHGGLLYYTLIERATFLLYNDAKRMHERNKCFEIDAFKDTWGKTNDTFS